MEARAAIADVIAGSMARAADLSKVFSSRPSCIVAISAAVMLSVDSVAPPRKAVRSDPRTAAPRAFVRRARRARRRSITDGDGDDGCPGGWDAGDGSFGGGGGGGSGGGGGGRGRWWDLGGPDWGEWGSTSASSDPAFDVVYGVICCVALYSCTGFAFKRICQFLENKDKVPFMRLVPHLAS
ncbi:glycine-rich protein [Wolffia australiana]